MTFYRTNLALKADGPVIRDHSIVLVRRIVDCEFAICEFLNRTSRPPAISRFFVFISWLGDGRVWYALILTLPLVSGETGLVTSMSMVKVGVVNLVLYKIIKSLTGRARPCAVSESIILGTAPLDQYSFPSGHTMHAVAFSMVVTTHNPELAWVLAPFSCLVAISRVILGLHYPTDVLAGGAIGACIASTLPAS
jgi:undecaprenyl-diphosphatase